MESTERRREVVAAVQQGMFHVYAVSTADEGIKILTGVDAGERREDGTYQEGSINYRVDKQLKEMAAKLRHFYGPEGGEGTKQAHA